MTSWCVSSRGGQPSVIDPDGRCEWWINGVQQPEHEQQKNIISS